MSKRFVIYILLAGFLLGIIVANAQEPQSHVVFIKNKDTRAYKSVIDGFTSALRKGRISARLTEYQPGEIGALKALNPDLILTLGTSVTRSAAGHLKQIPIVFSMVVDPEGSGIKGDNIAGVSLDIPPLLQFEALKRVIPGLKTVGVLYNPAENEVNIKKAAAAAQNLGLILKPFPVKNQEEIPGIGTLAVDALWIFPDTLICQPPIIKRILLSGMQSKIPIMGISPRYVKAGALIALSCDYKDIGKQAGEISVRILKGERCTDIKIVQPRQVKLFLNAAVADRLGITIPRKILKEAEEVFGQ